MPPLSLDEKVERAEALKAQGNEHFKSGAYQEAARSYYNAYLHTKGLGDKLPFGVDAQSSKDADGPTAQARELSRVLLLNLAACQLKLERYERALYYCDESLKLAESGKAYFRRGQANRGLNNLIRAENDLRKAQVLEPRGTTPQPFRAHSLLTRRPARRCGHSARA